MKRWQWADVAFEGMVFGAAVFNVAVNNVEAGRALLFALTVLLGYLAHPFWRQLFELREADR